MFFKTRFEKEKTSALSDTEASSRFAGLGSFAIAGSIARPCRAVKGSHQLRLRPAFSLYYGRRP
jgi:hypothetical protein